MSTTTTLHDQQEKHQQMTAIEQKLQNKFEQSKTAFIKTYEQCKSYINASRASLESLWQYEEFRLGAYIFGLLSIIPFAFFVLFIASVFFVTTVLTSFVWTFFICSALMIGLMVLVPLLFGFSIIAGFLIVGYYVYKQTKAKSN